MPFSNIRTIIHKELYSIVNTNDVYFLDIIVICDHIMQNEMRCFSHLLILYFVQIYKTIHIIYMCGSEEGVIKPSYIASSKPARAIQREYFSKENKTSSTIMNLLGTCLSFITFVYYMQGQRFSQSLALQIRNKWNHKSSDLCNCCFLLVLVMRKSSVLQFPFPLFKVQK